MHARTPAHQAETRRRDDRLEALLALGFERSRTEPVASEMRRVGRRWKLTQTRATMGTVASIAILDASRSRAEQAAGDAWKELDRCVDLLNRYDGASAVAVLNCDGRLRDAPEELLVVLEAAARLARVSEGAFDVTVKPVVDVMRAARELGREPDPADLLAVRDSVGWRNVAVHDGGVELRRAGAGVTLDGIAKGFVVDRVAAVFEAHGIDDFLINAGGDIRVAGLRDAAAPWRVAVQDPDGGESPALLEPRAGAVATSGSYEITFNGDHTLHHIVEPASAVSPNACRSVTATAPTAMLADALATAVFVMGPAAGRALVESLSGCECLILGTAHEPVRSSGWRAVEAQ